MRQEEDYYLIGDEVYFVSEDRICKGKVIGRRITDYDGSANHKWPWGADNCEYLVGSFVVEGVKCYSMLEDLIFDLKGNISDIS